MNTAQQNEKTGVRKVTDKGEIRTDDLEVTYNSDAGQTVALSKTSLTIHPGEFVCVLGPSGCRKSTLLNVIAGFVQATEGRALLDGNAIEQPGADRSMVFQQHSLLPWKTVRANIGLGPKFVGDIEASSTVNHFLKMVGLQKYENHYPDQLSGGMQQRVGIARALATFPRVLLMDEPFAALDYQTRLMMQENLLSLWEEFGTTVVFVTHDVDEAIFLSDRILLMSASPGRIVKDIANPLPRPRTQMISSEAKFLEIKRDCMKIIRTEALSTF